MITKTLQTSAGDFSTLQSVGDFIVDNITTDDINILIEPGATFGTETANNTINPAYASGETPVNFNGHTVTFKTNPSNLASTATILGSITLLPGFGSVGHSGAGFVNFENLFLGLKTSSTDAEAQQFPFVNKFNRYPNVGVTITNCKVAIKAQYPDSFSYDASLCLAGTANNNIINSTVMISSSFNLFFLNQTNAGKLIFKNNVILFNAPGESSDFYVEGGGKTHYGNTFHNYGTGGLTVKTGTFNTNEIGNPNLTCGTAITTTSDEVATMLAKAVTLTASSANCIGNANVTYATATDINGKTRA